MRAGRVPVLSLLVSLIVMSVSTYFWIHPNVVYVKSRLDTPNDVINNVMRPAEAWVTLGEVDEIDEAERYYDQQEQTDEATTKDNVHTVATRLCTQAERIRHMEWYCEHRIDARRAPFMTPVARSLIDHKHNFTYCWMSKAGCTSLKAYILEANGMNVNEHSAGDSLNKVHFVDVVNRYGLEQMHQKTLEERWKIVQSYFNIFTIRHPLDRLVSYYRDKILDDDRSSTHPKRQSEILRFMRPEVFKANRTLNLMPEPQRDLGRPRFEEFLTWAYKVKQTDEHWSFIIETCHPCAHRWGAMLRIETMENDGKILQHQLQTNLSNIPVRHSHEGPRDYSIYDKHLSIYENVTTEVMDYWLAYFRMDMDMFGYQWDRTNLVASCAIHTDDGVCC